MNRAHAATHHAQKEADLHECSPTSDSTTVSQVSVSSFYASYASRSEVEHAEIDGDSDDLDLCEK